MAGRQRYSFARRQRDLAKAEKRDAKRARRAAVKLSKSEAPPAGEGGWPRGSGAGA